MNHRVTAIAGRGIPLAGNDIDTDRIIPARFLRCITFDGLGQQVFLDDRQAMGGEHPFDRPEYRGAKILAVNANFGCGSSREHAPQAIARWGIEAIVGESFAEIFFGNCLAMGIPCVAASHAEVETLQAAIVANPQLELVVDVEQLQVSYGDRTIGVEMKAGPQQMLVEGTWDTCAQLADNATAIRATAAQLAYTSW
ncbi:3-isopropylmalate dehydratase small subunit [Synechococcus sp. PCC 7336]|uniref:3-isopropylmalate dehydratase small subunit n=1 Tax=Synechococcus sp. PCC 7336 TaxID=195250 RepID=UPI00034B00B4|nr:3-isopropylmalate dehydratase small subunit [Synechococcus sp. PCC 7336]